MTARLIGRKLKRMCFKKEEKKSKEKIQGEKKVMEKRGEWRINLRLLVDRNLFRGVFEAGDNSKTKGKLHF